MNRRAAFALLLVACSSSAVIACGGSTSDLVGGADSGPDATQPVGCTSQPCSNDDGGSPGNDGSPANDDGGTDATVPDDTGTGEDGGGSDAPSNEDAADGSSFDAGHDSGETPDAGSDSGEQNVDAGTDAGEHTVDSGTDAGDHTVDSGTDAGEHTVDSGTDAGEHTVDSGTDAGSSTVDSGNDAGEHTVDSGTDAGEVTIPDGGLPPSPGEVSCGSTTCAVATDECCLTETGGGTCQAVGTTCPTKTATVHCNEESDCSGGQICCVTISIASQSATAACQTGPCPSAGSGGAQACRTDQECGSGGPCEVQDCNGVTLELCGQPNFFGLYQCTLE